MREGAGTQLDEFAILIKLHALADVAHHGIRVEHRCKVLLAHRGAVKVKGIEDVTAIVLVGRDHLIRENVPGRVHVERIILLEELGIFKVVQRGKNAIHIVAVNHRDRIGKILSVGELRERTANRTVVAILIMIEVERIVERTLLNGRVYLRTGNIEPCVRFNVLAPQGRKVNWVIGELLLFHCHRILGHLGTLHAL